MGGHSGIVDKVPIVSRKMKLLTYGLGTCSWLWVFGHFKKDWHLWIHGHDYNWEQFHSTPSKPI